MVGDSRIDYETAKSAEARCCLVSYGFSHHTLDQVPVEDAWIASDRSMLADIITRFVASD
jgi:phosphoglycolate phosphatase-like HAD superfamily hydrolase